MLLNEPTAALRIVSVRLLATGGAGIKSDGTNVESVEGVGCTLLANTTYFFPFGDPDAPTPTETPLTDVQLKWDIAIAFVATIETCSFPKFKRHVRAGSDAVVDVSDVDTTPGNWLPQNPPSPSTYVPVVGGTVGTGATSMTVTVTAGNPGGCEFSLGNFGSKRGHVKIVVGAPGGVVRAAGGGKAGG